MTVAAGDSHPFPIYGGRFRVIFPILDADGDLVTAASALDSERSIDQGTFADCTNEATEIATSSGMYYLDLIYSEMQSSSTAIIVKTTTVGAKTTPMVLYPRRFPILRAGTSQAGAASTITLDSGASVVDDYYNGCIIQCTNDSPANVRGQTRWIVDYVGSTKVATVNSNWGTNPSNVTTFEIYAPENAGVAAFQGSETQVGAAGFQDVNVEKWNNTAVPAEHTAGYPIATIKDGTGTGEIDTTSGGVLVSAIAANAITAAAIATDAVDGDALAASALSEIKTQVTDALAVDTYAEASAVPAATSTLKDKINWLFALARNKVTMTNTTQTLRNDADAGNIATSTHSDDGTTYTRGKWL